MIRFGKILLISALLFAGCTKQDKGNPNVLSKEKMVAILTDMQLADAASRLRLMPEEYLKNPKKWYIEIMESHQTDTAAFSASLKYYTQYPEMMEKIYEEVNVNLMKEIGMKPPEEKSKK